MDPLLSMPIIISPIFSIIGLIISALFVEVHYVGRLGIAANVLCSWQMLFPYWSQLPEFIQIWLNVGLFVAALALLSYLARFPLEKSFYKWGRILFGALSILIILIYVWFAILH